MCIFSVPLREYSIFIIDQRCRRAKGDRPSYAQALLAGAHSSVRTDVGGQTRTSLCVLCMFRREETMAFHVRSQCFSSCGCVAKSIVAQVGHFAHVFERCAVPFLLLFMLFSLCSFVHLLLRLQARLANSGSAEPPAFKSKESVQVMPGNLVKNTLPTALNSARKTCVRNLFK